MITTVSSGDGLMAALKAAHAGDTIQLASGDYSLMTLQSLNFAGSVRITSADPNNEAVISGLIIKNSSGLSFDHLKLDFETKLGGAMQVVSSHDISIDHVEMAGSPTNRVGNGLVIGSSTNVTVTNSEIHDFGAGIAHTNSSNVLIQNNTIHDISIDGIRGGGSSNVTITGNTFTDFHQVQYAHNDAIQFWTAGTTGTTHDLTITDNTFVRGDGDVLQGVFMNNEASIPYQNVTISGNAIVGGAYHGITVENANGLSITGNLVDGYKDMVSWIQVKDSANVALANNVSTSYIIANNTNLTETNDLGIKQSDIGDTSLLQYWQANGHTAPDSALAPTTAAPSTALAGPSTSASLVGLHLVGLASDTSLAGTAGADTLDGGAGGTLITSPENLMGGPGDDLYQVHTYYAQPTEVANGGIDTVQTDLGSYTLRPNVENLVLTGTSAQTGNGTPDNNVLTANAVKSTLNGLVGNDTLVSIGGADTLTGGAGQDHFVFNAMPKAAAVITDFTHGQDTLDLHNLLGGYHGADPIADGWVKFATDATGTTVYVDPDGGANSFTAIAKLTGVTTPLNASDISAQSLASPAMADPARTLIATAGDETLQGGTGNDTIGAQSGSNYLRGGDGADSVQGGSGFDDINGNVGNDTAHGNAGDDWVVGGKDNDMLSGDAGSDVVWGNIGNDTLDGGDGVDQIRGGQGDDSITGGAGNDFVSGDRGSDTETGGAGADVFHSFSGAGIDKVLDFNLAEGDRVQLDPGTAYTLSQVGADTVIDMSGGDEMILVGVKLSTLTSGWIFEA